jgi:hypothetical protein
MIASSVGTRLASRCAMQHSTWTAPTFEEMDLGSEVGAQDEDEAPAFLLTPRTRARRLPIALARRMQRTQRASRGFGCGG